MKKHIFRHLTYIFIFLTFNIVSVVAQPGFPGDEEPIPVDGGVSFLIASGIALGARMFYKNRKN